MKDYRIQIQLTSNLYTPLHGDTLFGMLCWMILYKEGENVLEKFLKDSQANPQLLVSSAFPKNELPMPVVASQINIEFTDNNRKYSKKLKKQKFISRENFLKYRDSFNVKVLQEKLLSEMENSDAAKKSNSPDNKKVNTGKSSEPNKFLAHNSINRLTGMVAEDGGLFFSEVIATPTYIKEEIEEDSIFDIYISVAPEYDSIVKDAFTALSTYGFGKDSSTGGGQFSIKIEEEKELFAGNKIYSHSITLAPIVPAENDPLDIQYQLFTRYGKIGHGSDIGSDSEKGYFKKPILMFQTGAVVANPIKGYAGRLLEGVHNNPKVKHSGYAQLLGLNIVSKEKL